MKEALLALAGKLLSPTRTLEGGSGEFFRQSVHELAADRTLEGLIRQSMPTSVSAPAPAAAKPVPSAAIAQASPPVRAQVTSSRQEYQGALARQDIVDALLQFAAQAKPKAAAPAAPRGGQAPKAQAPVNAATSAKAPVPPKAPEPSFSFADIPTVEAEPKRAESFRRSVGHAQSILRPRS